MNNATRDVWVGGMLLVASACALPEPEPGRPARRSLPRVVEPEAVVAPAPRGLVPPVAPVARARPRYAGPLRCKG